MTHVHLLYATTLARHRQPPAAHGPSPFRPQRHGCARSAPRPRLAPIMSWPSWSALFR